MYTQYDDLINDKLNKLNKTNNNGELSKAFVLLLQSQFGHAALARPCAQRTPSSHIHLPGHVPDSCHESHSPPGFELHPSVRSRIAAPCPACSSSRCLTSFLWMGSHLLKDP